jgi:hypothetical protein
MDKRNITGDWDEYLPAPDVNLTSAADGWSRLLVLLDDERALEMAIRRADKELRERYACIAGGQQRDVFNGGTVVYKLPLPQATRWEDIIGHVWANLDEVFACEQDAHNVQIAPCRLVWHETGIPIVVMEHVDVLDDDDIEEELMDVVDSDQIGWSDLLDRQVCFDAGSGPRQVGYRDSPWRRHLRAAGANRLSEIAGGQLALEIAA